MKTCTRVVKTANRARKRWDVEMARLVMADSKDEVARFKRRMHLHLSLGACLAILTFASIINLIDSAAVVGTTAAMNAVQEYLDYAGRF